MSRKLSKILTAYVDGELSPRQRRAVRRYLTRSLKARKLVRALKRDARQLQTVNWPTLNRDLSDTILDQIKTLPEFQFAVAANRRRSFAWAPRWSAAAAVLLAVGLTSYLYFAQPTGETSPVAQTPPGSDTTSVEPLPAALGQPEAEPLEAPRRSNTDVFAFPNLKVPQVRLAQVQVPSIFELSNLQKPADADHFKHDLRQTPVSRLDLFTLGSTRGLDKLRGACKAEGIDVRIDAAAEEFVMRGLERTWAVYIENIRPEEAARLLARLSADDKKVGHFQTAVLAATTAEDMAGVLGGTGKELAPPSQRPVDQGTAGEILSGLPGEDSTAKARTPRLVVVPHEPMREMPYDEVKNLLDGYRHSRPGTVQLLVVLWGPEQ